MKDYAIAITVALAMCVYSIHLMEGVHASHQDTQLLMAQTNQVVEESQSATLLGNGMLVTAVCACAGAIVFLFKLLNTRNEQIISQLKGERDVIKCERDLCQKKYEELLKERTNQDKPGL
jgi:hypothetical protein